MWLALAHPRIAVLSCDDCAKWVYKDGILETWAGGRKPLPRADGKTPCWTCPKVPKPPGTDVRTLTRADAVELTETNWQVYGHYLRCKATGRFPDDETVAHDAAIIASAEAEVARDEERRLARMLLQPK